MQVADELICAPTDPTGVQLQWPSRIPLVIGAFVISVSILLAVQRHEFTAPNWGLPVLVAITLPWVLDMFGLPPMGQASRLGYPVLVAWCLVVIGGVWALGTWDAITYDFTPFLVVILVGEMTSTAGARFGAALVAIGASGLLYSTYVRHISGNAIWIFALIIGWLGGLAMRHQARIASELLVAQSRLEAQAREDERRYLAREIHDLIAHSLAVSMLHLSGARLSLAAGDTEEAMAALSDAEAAGRSAMTEIHRTVGLLGTDSEGTAPPTPCAADLPDLVDGFRHAGLDVHLSLEGDLTRVPMVPGLTAYRLIQESLSNAVKHAPGAPVDLRIAVEDGVMMIGAVNPVVGTLAEPSSGGNGVRGMVERVALLGGTVLAGNGDGTWKVRARIPWAAGL